MVDLMPIPIPNPIHLIHPIHSILIRPKSIYLAASLRHAKDQMLEYAVELRSRGIEVTSRWIDTVLTSDPLDDPRTCIVATNECLVDIDTADTFVYFTEFDSVGKHIEYGYAWSHGKQIVLIGKPTSVFHFRPGIIRVSSWLEFLDLMDLGGGERVI